MDLLAFMEIMGTTNIPLIASFFIGLMTALSPCPLTTNIAAIAAVSKKVDNGKHTLLVGFLYALGRTITYVSLSFLIIWIGISSQTISLFLRGYGEAFLGPFLIILGILMSGLIKFPTVGIFQEKNKLVEKLSEKSYLGIFLLGVVFALAFCPFSAVLFFGMLIPLAITAKDFLFIPTVFSFATALPVIIFSALLAHSVSKVATLMNKVQTFDKWMKRIVSIIFVLVGIYYIIMIYFA